MSLQGKRKQNLQERGNGKKILQEDCIIMSDESAANKLPKVQWVILKNWTYVLGIVFAV